MPALSKVELYAAIRRDAREGMSAREIERNGGVSSRERVDGRCQGGPSDLWNGSLERGILHRIFHVGVAPW
jgi:hypothetical protein